MYYKHSFISQFIYSILYLGLKSFYFVKGSAIKRQEYWYLHVSIYFVVVEHVPTQNKVLM